MIMSYEQFCVSRMFGGSGGILWWFVEVSTGELSSMSLAALTLIATRVNKRKLVFALCVSVSLSVDANTWQSPAVVQLHRRFFFCPRRHVSISTFLKFFTSPPTYYRILQMHHFSIYLDSELSYRL